MSVLAFCREILYNCLSRACAAKAHSVSGAPHPFSHACAITCAGPIIEEKKKTPMNHLENAQPTPEELEVTTTQVEQPEAEQPELEHPEPKHPMDTEIAEAYAYKSLKHGQILDGTVVSASPTEILIDVGSKSEGFVRGRELEQMDEAFLANLSEGSKVLVYVVRPEDRQGNIVLSLARAQQEHDWRESERLLESREFFERKIIGCNRGGLIVEMGQVRGFAPASQLAIEYHDERPTRTEGANRWAHLVGKRLLFKVIELDRQRNRLILSERLAMRDWRRQQKVQLLEELHKGDIRKGVVTSLTNFGAFVDLGGADGLIHLSELSWGQIRHPSEVLKVGQEVEVYVLKMDRKRKRIGLSLRQLQPEPWTVVHENYAVGQLLEGTITNLTDFGAFARIGPGIEGLIHISELADHRVTHPREVVKPRETLTLRIIRIDPQRRRMALSLKQVPEDGYVEFDWREATEELAVEEVATEPPMLDLREVEAEPPAEGARAELEPAAVEEVEAEPVAEEVETQPAAAEQAAAEPEAEALEAEPFTEEAEAEPPATEETEAEPEPEAVAAEPLTEETDAEPATEETQEAEAELPVADEAAAELEAETVEAELVTEEAEAEPPVTEEAEAEPEAELPVAEEAAAEAVAAEPLTEETDAEPAAEETQEAEAELPVADEAAAELEAETVEAELVTEEAEAEPPDAEEPQAEPEAELPVTEEAEAEAVAAEPLTEETDAEPAAEEAEAEPLVAEEPQAEPEAETVEAEPVAEETETEPVTEEAEAEPSADEEAVAGPAAEEAEAESAADEEANVESQEG